MGGILWASSVARITSRQSAGTDLHATQRDICAARAVLQYSRLSDRLMPKLEHDPQLIERLALMQEGNATAHLRSAGKQAGGAPRSRWSKHEMLAASSLVIAASYWSLITPSKALLCYRRATEIYRASHDRFHWRSLQSTVLPAEPEAVAITTAMSMMSHAMFQRSISDMPNLDAHGRLLVEVGEGMQGAARDRAG